MIPLRDDNPTRVMPILTFVFIAANVLVFMYQMSLGPRGGEQFVFQFGTIPAELLGSADVLPARLTVVPASLTIFTSMFLHGGLMHLIGNMLYLWIFGNNIEDAMGHARFVIFYLLCGVGSALAHVFTNPDSTIPTIGASGAISGVLGAYLLLYPRAQVLVLVPLGFFMRLMYIPAGFVLGFWFLLQLINSAVGSGGEGGGVAWMAHVGGFVAGMALVGLFKRSSVHFFNPAHYHPTRFDYR